MKKDRNFFPSDSEKSQLWVLGKDGALFRAAARGNIDNARSLIERGADVNTSSHEGITPLHRATESGHVAIIQLLLQKGADSSASTTDGKTARDWAAQQERQDIVDLLK